MSRNYCIHCGNAFEGKANQSFCSKKCRNKYSRNNYMVLTLKKQWFDMILSGVKKEEYREMKPYWEKRFNNYFGKVHDFPEDETKVVWNDQKKIIVFRNGYGNDKPEFSAECSISEGYGNEFWGAEKNKKYFVLTIHKIFGIKNVDCFSLNSNKMNLKDN